MWSSPVATRDNRTLPTHGAKVCRWIETNCVYAEGDWLFQPVRLRPFQKRFLWRLYEYWPETERRRYKRALLGMGKGNGKTPLASWVAAYELCGQVNVAPHIVVAAASLEQANMVFGDLKMMLDEPSPSPLAPFVEPFDLEIHLKGEPGKVKRVAAAQGTNDGKRVTSFIADELHEWVGRVRRVYMILEGAVAKREQGFTLGITTAGSDETSLLGEQYAYGKALHSGETLDDETLFEWYEAAPGLDLDDPNQWLEAVYQANPAAGDFNSLEFIRSRFDGALRIPRYEWERYHADRWTQSDEQWLPPGEWDSLAAPNTHVKKGERVALAFRGAYASDAAALVGATAEGHVFLVKAWEKPGDPDYLVPRREVEATVARAMKQYRVWRFLADRGAGTWDEQIEGWSDAYGERVAIAYDIRQNRRWADACGKFFSAVAADHSLTHDRAPELARALAAAEPKETTAGTHITAPPPAIAAVIAYDTVSTRQKRSAYADHGLETV